MRPFRLNQIKGAKEIVKVQGFKKFFKRSYRRYFADPDFEIKNAIKRYSNDYEVFIDIGAAVGSITFSVASSFSRCICFEPEERNYRDFLNKLKNLGFSNIQIFNYALGKEKGKKKFFVSETARLDNRFNIEDNEKFKEYEVEVDTLDNTCTKLGINEKCVIKIDVQGGEIDVMKGARKLLEYDCAIISEFWPWAMQLNNTEPSEYVDYMNSMGYSFFDLKNQLLKKEDLEKLCAIKNKKFVHDDFVIKKK